MGDTYEERERAWQRMAQAAKRRKQGAFFKSVEEESNEKKGLL